MTYYLIPFALASRLGVTQFRHGNSSVGFLVTAGDLAPVGIEAAVAEGAAPKTEAEAINIINQLKSV